MRLFELFLDEARGPKELIGHRGALTWITQNIRSDQYGQYGVTLTMINKLGVNPKSTYNTPVGIYFYPLSFYVELIKRGEVPPFPENPNFIQIFRITANPENVLNLDTMSEQDFRGYIRDIKSKFAKFAAAIPETSVYVEQGRAATDELMDELVEDSIGGSRVNTPAGRFWYVMWRLSKDIFNIPWERKKPRQEYSQALRSPVVWNWLSRQLGISVYLDSKGIIHQNEPEQGVVIDPAAVELVKTLSVSDSRVEVSRPSENPQGLTGALEDTIQRFIKHLQTRRPGFSENQIQVGRKYIKYITYLLKQAGGHRARIEDWKKAYQLAYVVLNSGFGNPETIELSYSLAQNSYLDHYGKFEQQYLNKLNVLRQELDKVKSQGITDRSYIALVNIDSTLNIGNDLFNSQISFGTVNDNRFKSSPQITETKKRYAATTQIYQKLKNDLDLAIGTSKDIIDQKMRNPKG